MKIAHILKKKGSTYQAIAPEQMLSDAVALMMEHRIGSLVVMDGDALAGIVSERDVMRAINEHKEAFASLQVREVMSSRVVTTTPEEGLDTAMDLMLHNETGARIRHLPVMEAGRLAGIISIGDVIDALLTETQFENRLLKNFIKNWPDED